jgi:hypothetical protein
MPQIKTISKWALASAKVFYRYLAVSAEVFCRHTFGIRYMNDIVVSFLIFFIYATVVGCFGQIKSPFLNFYLGCYFALVCFHIVSMLRRQNSSVHSYSSGAPWPFWHRFCAKPMVVDLILEPGFLLVVGLLLVSHDDALAIWFQLSALSLFFKRAVSSWKKWHHLMDVLDTRVEGEQLNEAVRQRTVPRARAATGAIPVSMGQASEPPQSQLPQSHEQIFGNLDPALRQIITPANSTAPNSNSRASQSNSGSHEYGGPLAHLPRIKSPRR